MRVAFHSKEMSSLSWARRLADEGNEVQVYTPPGKGRLKPERHIGDGIIPKALSRERWLDWGMADPQTVWFFDCTDHGELADRLRQSGRLVVGGGVFCDKLENDREIGARVASHAGIPAPPTRRFTAISDAIRFLTRAPTPAIGDGGWVWKPNQNLGCDCSIVGKSADDVVDELGAVSRRLGDTHTGIVQERIPGVALSTMRWWNGSDFVGPIEGTIEEKRLCNGDLGPPTGCSFNLVWFYGRRPKVEAALHWDELAQLFRRANAPPGPYDINAIHNRTDAYFLEWTPRLGIDAELVSQRAISNLGTFLMRLATGGPVDELFDTSKAYLGVRLSVPPYPTDSDDADIHRSPAMGVAVRGIDGFWKKHFLAVGISSGPHGYEVADPNGLVGVMMTSGTSLDEMNKELLRYAKTLRIRGLQYRTDAADNILTDLDDLSRTGWGSVKVIEEAA